jgi:hypothetical protein
MIATMADCHIKMTVASLLVLASMSSASAQSHDRLAGARNLAPLDQQAVQWEAMAQVRQRVRGSRARAPSVPPRSSAGNPDSNYWYERNREEFRGRW